MTSTPVVSENLNGLPCHPLHLILVIDRQKLPHTDYFISIQFMHGIIILYIDTRYTTLYTYMKYISICVYAFIIYNKHMCIPIDICSYIFQCLYIPNMFSYISNICIIGVFQYIFEYMHLCTSIFSKIYHVGSSIYILIYIVL